MKGIRYSYGSGKWIWRKGSSKKVGVRFACCPISFHHVTHQSGSGDWGTRGETLGAPVGGVIDDRPYFLTHSTASITPSRFVR
jgi:hypothetical protein